jgi:hypothetical protein
MTRRVFQLLGLIALTVANALNVEARLIGQDSFEASSFSNLWKSPQGVTLQKPGGAHATLGFARLGPNGGQLNGNLSISDNAAALPDFSVEFYFRIQSAKKGSLELQIQTRDTADPTPPFRLSFDTEKGWGITLNSSRQSLAALKSVSPNTWYRLRFVGRDWGETNARYSVQLSEPAGTIFTTSITNLIPFQNGRSVSRPAQEFTLSNTATCEVDLDEVRVAALTPYKGIVLSEVDTKTLTGKVMCGYQGWFGAPGDGSSEHGWRHWTKNGGLLEDGNAKVDLWPDVSELDSSQRFPTGFKMADGRPAEVFSSFKKPTVLKHFEWMQDYGIDGVFVQRFANGLQSRESSEHCDTVLANCREGANLHGRAYAVMYDLSGLPAGHIDDVINDWRALRNEMLITEDPAYLNHRGKPVVAVWGIGFNDHRAYTLAECRRLIEFLKNDPEAGGCTVMLGVPTNWRELRGDAVNDPALLEVLAMADIISPWTVGRYSNAAGAARYMETTLKPDLNWCGQRGIDFLPVIFPGFSWHNMKDDGPSNQIPRQHGQFLWSQFCNVKRANASMVYVAMFDEVDEGTAIFKCLNDVPVGQKSKFVTLEGLPSDFYLKMVGAGTKLIRGETTLENSLSFSSQTLRSDN